MPRKLTSYEVRQKLISKLFDKKFLLRTLENDLKKIESPGLIRQCELQIKGVKMSINLLKKKLSS